MVAQELLTLSLATWFWLYVFALVEPWRQRSLRRHGSIVRMTIYVSMAASAFLSMVFAVVVLTEQLNN